VGPHTHTPLPPHAHKVTYAPLPPCLPPADDDVCVTQEETTLSEALKRGNPVVFFDITIAGRASGRVKMELFKDVAPRVTDSDTHLLFPTATPFLSPRSHAPPTTLLSVPTVEFFCVSGGKGGGAALVDARFCGLPGASERGLELITPAHSP
jgi:hypothetical protein